MKRFFFVMTSPLCVLPVSDSVHEVHLAAIETSHTDKADPTTKIYMKVAPHTLQTLMFPPG